MISLSDTYGRTFKTLRISLLSKCNFGCSYCTQGLETSGEYKSGPELPVLNLKELIGLVYELHQLLGLRTIRLTGGEPLLYPQLPDLVGELSEMGISQIKLTTNGFLLSRLARLLKGSGLQDINVSLDALDEDVFFLMSRRQHLQKVLEGIDAALEAGIFVKLNAVIMKGINENQLLPLLEYAREKGVVVRFLELMAMGHLYQNSNRHFFSQEQMLDAISNQYPVLKLKRKPGSTANYWRTEQGQVFGIIANNSEPFCSDCDRLRLDSHGNIYGCLSSNDPISILHANDESDFREKLHQALLQKQPINFQGSKLSMMAIGG